MSAVNQFILQSISDEYYDLNGTYFETLENPPSSLEFSRLVHISRPVLIKGFQLPTQLGKLWTDEHLIQRMGDRKVSVAVTPNGRADAISLSSEKPYFVEPFVDSMTMAGLIDKLLADSKKSEIHYLQSQNGNIYTSRHFNSDTEDLSEFGPLRQNVPSEISWCSEALGRPPDAVNLWIGNHRSVTSIHSDPYENVYCVVRGAKHFTLFPPTEGWCLKERMYPRAIYTRTSPTSELVVTPLPEPTPEIRWSSVSDPDLLPPMDTHPLNITVEAGETLYLPAGWWHHVRQSGEIVIALNWWYDMEMSGMSWVFLSFLRGIPVQDGSHTIDDSEQVDDR